jgi:hypothetical protein
MEHSKQGVPPIINEAHSFPVIPGPAWKRKLVYVLILLWVLASLKSETVVAQVPLTMLPNQGSVKADASLRTAQVAYKLDRGKIKETGIYLSADSAALMAPGQATRFRAASYDETSGAFRVDFDGLEPDCRYFYKIYIRDRQNKFNWSDITAIRTPGFNIRWTGAQKWITANNVMEIMLSGESVDTDRNQYQVFYSGLACELIKITGSPESPKSYYTIRLPRNAPVGRHRLVMTYKQKRIFEENIDVL